MAGSQTSAYINALQRKYARQMQPRRVAAPATSSFSTGQEPVNSFQQQAEELTGFDRFASSAMDRLLGGVGQSVSTATGGILPAAGVKQVISSGLETPLAQNVMDALSTPLYGVTGALQNTIDTVSAATNPGRATSRQKRTLSNIENAADEGGIENILKILNTFNPGTQATQVWTDSPAIETLEAKPENGNERVTGADIIDSLAARNGPSEETINIGGFDTHVGYDWLRGLGGFGLDVALDPLSYVTGAGALKLGRVASLTGRQIGPAGARAAEISSRTGRARDFTERFKTNWAGTQSSRKWARDETGAIIRDANGKKVRNPLLQAGRVANWGANSPSAHDLPNAFGGTVREVPETATASRFQSQIESGRRALPAGSDEILEGEIVDDIARATNDGDILDAEFVEEFPQIAPLLTPPVEIPNKPIVPKPSQMGMIDNMLSDMPEGELGSLPAEFRTATKLTNAESTFDRSALEIESPFIRQLIEETAPETSATQAPAAVPQNRTYSVNGKNMTLEQMARVRNAAQGGKNANVRWSAINEQVFRRAVQERRAAQEVTDGPLPASTGSLAPQGTPAPSAATAAASQASGGAEQVTRLTGPARKRWTTSIRKNYLKPGIITDAEYQKIIGAKTEEEFFDAVGQIRREAASPIIDAPDVPFTVADDIAELNESADTLIDQATVPEFNRADVEMAPAYKTPSEVEAARVVDTDGTDLTGIRDSVLKNLYDKHLSKEKIDTEFKYRSKGGAHRDSPTAGQGRGRWRKYVNTPAQVKTYDNIWRMVREELSNQNPPIKGAAQDAIGARRVARISQSVDEYLKAVGATPFFGMKNGFDLSISDVMTQLLRDPRLAPVLTTVDTRASTNQIVDAVAAMMRTGPTSRGKRIQVVREILEKDVRKNTTGGGTNSLTHPNTGSMGLRRWYQELTGDKARFTRKPNAADRARYNKQELAARFLDESRVEKWTQGFIRDNLKNLSESIADNYETFLTTQAANSKRYRFEVGRQADHLVSENVINEIGRKFSDSKATLTEYVDSVSDVHRNIDNGAEEIGANAEAVQMAHLMGEDAVADVITPSQQQYIDHKAKIADNFGTPKVQADNMRYFEQQVTARQLFRNTEAIADVDTFLDDVHDVVLGDVLKRAPVFNSKGLGGFGNLADAVPMARNQIHNIGPVYFNSLNKIANKWEVVDSPIAGSRATMFDDVAATIMARNAEGLKNFPAEAVDEIRYFINTINGLNETSLRSGILDNFALGNGVNHTRQNFIMDTRNVGFQYNETRAAAQANMGEEAFRLMEAKQKTKMQGWDKYKNKKVPNQDVQAALKTAYAERAKPPKAGQKWGHPYDREPHLNLQKAVKENLANQWADADIPLRKFGKREGLSDYRAFFGNQITAHLDALAEQSVATSAYMTLKREGALSMTPKPGWFKVSREGALGSNLPEGTYFHPDLKFAMGKVEALVNDVYRKPNAAVKFVSEWVMPLLDTWKTGMTIYRPGHHVRNAVGDITLSQLAGRLSTPKMFKLAHRVNQAAGGTKFKADAIAEKQAAEAAKSLEYIKSGGQSESIVATGTPALNIKLKGGTPINLDYMTINDSALNRGILPSAHVRENLLNEVDDAARGGAQNREKIRDKLSWAGGRVRPVAVKVGEVRDRTIRLAHYMEFVEKEARNYTNVKELFDDAASEVRKFHPDGTGLTQWERDYMQPLIPFYSWTRKAIPLVMEAALVNPARFMLFPKAMYAIATAQGIDLEGYGNPFPDDQLFPSFLRERALGPTLGNAVDGYVGINPGFAHTDVLNMFSGAPAGEGIAQSGIGQGIGSSLNPIAKLPFEVISGTNLGTGAPITDWSDYVDMQIPGLNILNSAGGISATGALGADTVIGGDPYSWQSRAAERGLKTPVFNPATLNLLLGLGITDMSQENYINLAEIEQRNGRTY